MKLPTLRQLLLIVALCATDVDTRWKKQASLGMLGWRNNRNAVSHSMAADHPACEQTSMKLSHNQMRICQLYPDHMASANTGVRLATQECHYQLEWRRWNCTTPRNSSLIDSTAALGSRESALVHASVAAGVMYSVSRDCREGRIPACGCSRRRRAAKQVRWPETTAVTGDWQWGGCSDNADYGYKFTTSFVDARQREKNYPRHSTALKLTMMNLHNNEAGRLAVNNYMTVACKCHGVSGSCVLKTCWRQLPDFRSVGDRLLGRYDSASLATFNRHGTSLVRPARDAEGRRRRRRKKKRDDGRRISKEQLVHIQQSPDYCPATHGRRCLRRSRRNAVGTPTGRLGHADCDTLCCGRGYNEYRRSTTVRCRCRFVWCCRVVCDACRRTEDIVVCK